MVYKVLLAFQVFKSTIQFIFSRYRRSTYLRNIWLATYFTTHEPNVTCIFCKVNILSSAVIYFSTNSLFQNGLIISYHGSYHFRQTKFKDFSRRKTSFQGPMFIQYIDIFVPFFTPKTLNSGITYFWFSNSSALVDEVSLCNDIL